MAHKALSEFDAHSLLGRLLTEYSEGKVKLATRYVEVTTQTKLDSIPEQAPWVNSSKLVVKVDQLVKRRGKNGLVLLDATWAQAKEWLQARLGKTITIEGTTGVLTNFVITEYLPHQSEDEYYVCIRTLRENDEILFYKEGGINVGDVDAKASRLHVGVWNGPDVSEKVITERLLSEVPHDRKAAVATFIACLYKMFVNAGFVYLEINPLVFVGGQAQPVDLAAKLDDTSQFECQKFWGDITFPPAFGITATEAEKFIARLDANSGASLKLTLLNPKGRVWTLVAGGGASVIYADTIADLGFGKELANYGEYSGNPSEDETFEYAKTVLDLMTAEKDPQGRDKVLLIGGGIANFTDVAKTFGGIIKAIRLYEERLKTSKSKIYVRRGGPNYKRGLERMRRLGDELGIPIEVYGPETHMTKIVSMALNS